MDRKCKAEKPYLGFGEAQENRSWETVARFPSIILIGKRKQRNAAPADAGRPCLRRWQDTHENNHGNQQRYRRHHSEIPATRTEAAGNLVGWTGARATGSSGMVPREGTRESPCGSLAAKTTPVKSLRLTDRVDSPEFRQLFIFPANLSKFPAVCSEKTGGYGPGDRIFGNGCQKKHQYLDRNEPRFWTLNADDLYWGHA